MLYKIFKLDERDKLRAEHAALKAQLDELYVPPGHFFSPLPALEDIRKEESRIFGGVQDVIPGINLYAAEQRHLLQQLARFYNDIPFQAKKTAGLRYYFENEAYSYGDGILLYSMMRHLEPKKMIEVGSGFSSCLILDTNDLFFQGTIATTFIEPYPQLLESLVTAEDTAACTLLPMRLQEVELSVFESLKRNDILFIDSTHVSKIDSDVNYLFFEILPRLASGVYVHFHDIFYPFEYPKWWVYEGRGWNEAYMLRAFLQHNNDFRIVLMNTFLRKFHGEFFKQHMPLCFNKMGGSIWLMKE